MARDRSERLKTIFVVALISTGMLIGSVIIVCLFGGFRKAAITTEITAVSLGLVVCLLLSVSFPESWYKWAAYLAAPIMGQCLLFILALTGGQDLKQDMLILFSSGFFVLTSSLAGGIAGKLLGRFISNRR